MSSAPYLFPSRRSFALHTACSVSTARTGQVGASRPSIAAVSGRGGATRVVLQATARLVLSECRGRENNLAVVTSAACSKLLGSKARSPNYFPVALSLSRRDPLHDSSPPRRHRRIVAISAAAPFSGQRPPRKTNLPSNRPALLRACEDVQRLRAGARASLVYGGGRGGIVQEPVAQAVSENRSSTLALTACGGSSSPAWPDAAFCPTQVAQQLSD